MAEVKWIKITTDMFNNRKIRHLRKLPDGNNIVLIWVMLLTMAGRCNASGMIFLTENIPYTPKMLADELDFEESTVVLALQALEQLNMIVTDNGYFAIAGWEEYQNIEGMDKIREQNRLRQQRRRSKERQVLLDIGTTCAYCGKEGATVDHIVPLSKGGANTADNTVRACLSCNMKKTNRPVHVFLNEMLSTSVEFEIGRILENPKLMAHVTFDDKTSRFVSRDVTANVTQCHATDKDIDKEEDIDIEKDNKSVRENTRTLFLRLLPNYGLSDELKAKMDEWITYKMERREPYKEQGMKILLRQVENNCHQYGDRAVCELIDNSMSNGWKGIIFDKLKEKPGKPYQKPTKADELNEFYKMAADWSETP